MFNEYIGDIHLINSIRYNKIINFIIEKSNSGNKKITNTDIRHIIESCICIKNSFDYKIPFNLVFMSIIDYMMDRSEYIIDFSKYEEKFDYNLYTYLENNDKMYKKYKKGNTKILVDYIAEEYFANNPNRKWLEIINKIEMEE